MPDPSLSPEAVEVQAPPRFRKKPIEVRAMRWTGDNADELGAFAGGKFEVIDPIDRHMLDDPWASASLLAAPHGSWVLVYTGDWIVRDDRGRFTRCHDADFREMYDVAPEPLELTPAEQAAKAKHPHMSTCHDQDCQECVREIAANRRTIKAVRPVIEADARADERAKVVAELVETLEGVYVGDPQSSLYIAGKSDGYLEAAGTVRHHYDPDGAPVAAASNPTDTRPEGE